MPEPLPTDGAPAPAPAGDAPVDGISPPKPAAPETHDVQPQDVARSRRLLLIAVGGVYGLYFLWSLILVVLLPDPTGGGQGLASIGVMGCVGFAALVLGVGVMGLQRVARANLSEQQKRRGMIRLILLVVPGLLVSGIVPFLILREPPLIIDIIDPRRSEDLVAPLSVTFSAERAIGVLQKLGAGKPVKLVWDFEGDGKPNDQTAVPQATAAYEKPGVYNVSAQLVMPDGSIRIIGRRMVIPRAVFSIAPSQPIVERPTKFSVGHLLSEEKQLKEVQWDFDGDERVDETSASADVLHTFYVVGKTTVTAVVLLENKTQTTYQRTIDVQEPPPLPFPVTLFTEPKNLLGPAPFGVVFRIETKEDVREVSWAFGDGKDERGKELFRVGHSFDKPGIYPVTVRVRSASGSLAELITIVRATDILQLSDLGFEVPEGFPPVTGSTITGQAPLSIQLKPRTSIPLVEFSWDPGDIEDVIVQNQTLNAVFRDTGEYTVTLMAKNPEGKSLRLPIKVRVQSPPIEAAVTVKREGDMAPMRVLFDASDSYIPPGEKVAGFKWIFGDERNQNVTPDLGGPQISHVYEKPGTYEMTLSVVMESGKAFITKKTIIVGKPLLHACFTRSRQTVEVGKPVRFDSSCTTGNPVSFLWDVRAQVAPQESQAQSPLQAYVATFDTPGEYTVTLTVKDTWGSEDTQASTFSVEQDTSPTTP